jgi:hypothetical protein
MFNCRSIPRDHQYFNKYANLIAKPNTQNWKAHETKCCLCSTPPPPHIRQNAEWEVNVFQIFSFETAITNNRTKDYMRLLQLQHSPIFTVYIFHNNFLYNIISSEKEDYKYACRSVSLYFVCYIYKSWCRKQTGVLMQKRYERRVKNLHFYIYIYI